jgi:3-isopropylmalate dehydrogenase
MRFNSRFNRDSVARTVGATPPLGETSMTNSADFRIAVFPGDGIGDEITQPTLRLIAKAAARTGGLTITPQHCPAGAAHYRDQGTALPKPSVETARKADAILLAAMGLPSVRYDDGTEISPQLDLRFELGLYAGVRPIRAIPGVPVLLADPRARDMDFIILRESTEGLFASHGQGEVTPDRATETMVLTRHTTERLHDFGLNLAAQRHEAGGADDGAAALDPGRADHREHVWRYPLRPRRRADRWNGLCALGRYRRRARPVPALPRLGPGYRRQGAG